MKQFKIGFFITLGDEKKCDYHCISSCGEYKRHKWKLLKSVPDNSIVGFYNIFKCVQCGLTPHK